jgi:hypothetical protein
MMEYLESIKDSGTYYAITAIINLLSKVSEDRFGQLTHGGEKLIQRIVRSNLTQQVVGGRFFNKIAKSPQALRELLQFL